MGKTVVKNRKSIIIYVDTDIGRMYLDKNCYLTSNRADAAEHYGTQFKGIIENDPLFYNRRARAEIVRR